MKQDIKHLADQVLELIAKETEVKVVELLDDAYTRLAEAYYAKGGV